MNDKEWDKIYGIGYDARIKGKDCDTNPYTYSEDIYSDYSAWQVGWMTADNDCYEGQYRF